MNLVVADVTARDAQLLGKRAGDGDYLRVFLLFALFIDIEPAAGFLAVVAQMLELVRNAAVAGILGKLVTS
jgi:hypothetical protein